MRNQPRFDKNKKKRVDFEFKRGNKEFTSTKRGGYGLKAVATGGGLYYGLWTSHLFKSSWWISPTDMGWRRVRCIKRKSLEAKRRPCYKARTKPRALNCKLEKEEGRTAIGRINFINCLNSTLSISKRQI